MIQVFLRAKCISDKEKSGKELPGYQVIKCNLIFNIMMCSTRKARFVAGGQVTDPPALITYSGVVSREMVRIALLLAASNDLDVCAADIGNKYLNVPWIEKVWNAGQWARILTCEKLSR